MTIRTKSMLPDVARNRARVAEAMLSLIVAKFLIDYVRFGRWRNSLGAVDNVTQCATNIASIYPVIRAVRRATERLRSEYVCLPRAMAVQWMLRRRGTPSTLVLGLARDMNAGALIGVHAWVEVSGTIVIGAMPDRDYVRGLALVQP
jgi:Transglutaminase-like superfamily